MAAWDSGADPVVVLTKLDVCDDFEKLAEAEAVAIGVPVLAVSNVTGEGSTLYRSSSDRPDVRPARILRRRQVDAGQPAGRPEIDADR